ncbi:hypothetical protein GETHLI_18940 [Geothrix limicola]|uniref:Uncharacterized protein n=1 Tax=Geothrix limicola TaxID=2927978 RepID=A0ABQ5QFG2_9BACT|nr:hypothetical protein [Geothrix limicola]GLH73392.1 hypothetical protein GETHLI_18940 [Geothrix limicola]
MRPQTQVQPRPSPQPRPQVQQAPRPYADQHAGIWQNRRARHWESEHQTWQQRGGYSGYRIPMDRYRGSFGPRHGFRMFNYPLLMIGGYPRFQYGGMWFSVMDPWPEYWTDDWYNSDDLYIEWFDGGYYLRNRRHPMDQLAITVMVH